MITKSEEATRPAASSRCNLSAIVGVASGRRIHRGINRHLYSQQHPRPLAWSKARRQNAVIDFARYSETVEHCWWQVQPRVIRGAVRGGVDIPLQGGDDTVVVAGHPSHFCGVGIEQPLLKVSHLRFERSRPLVDIEKYLVCEPARHATLAEFALGIKTVVRVKLVGIARQV